MRKVIEKYLFPAIAFVPLVAVGQEVTHMGVPTDQLVRLAGVLNNESFCGINGLALHKARPSGQIEDQPFIVPVGKRLVITDLRWIASRYPSETFLAGENLAININVHTVAGVIVGTVLSSGVRVPTDTIDLLSGDDHYVTGVAVFQNRQLCVLASSLHQPAESPQNSYLIREHSLASVTVLGYLVAI